jgi:hypothetical protein
MPKGSLVAPVAGATCLTLLLGFSAKSILQCLHKIALDWIGSAQYGQFFVVSFIIPHSYMFEITLAKSLGSKSIEQMFQRQLTRPKNNPGKRLIYCPR